MFIDTDDSLTGQRQKSLDEIMSEWTCGHIYSKKQLNNYETKQEAKAQAHYVLICQFGVGSSRGHTTITITISRYKCT